VIDRFNKKMAAVARTDLQIDPKIADLRDVLVHGRVLGSVGASFLWIFKVARPRANQSLVATAFASEMSEEWFAAQTQRVETETKKVGQLPGPGSVRIS
jgi:hypothetical protein